MGGYQWNFTIKKFILILRSLCRSWFVECNECLSSRWASMYSHGKGGRARLQLSERNACIFYFRNRGTYVPRRAAEKRRRYSRQLNGEWSSMDFRKTMLLDWTSAFLRRIENVWWRRKSHHWIPTWSETDRIIVDHLIMSPAGAQGASLSHRFFIQIY